MFRIDQLHYAIQDKVILSHISTKIGESKMTGILGCNGSGKSTLLSFLSKERESQGHVFYKDRPIEKWSLKGFAKEVAYLPQHQGFVYNLKVRDIVLMGRYPYKKAMADYSEADYAHVEAAMEKVGIQSMADEGIHHISGGELQRVLIAKVLAQDTDTVLLDEPTNHLDVRYKIELMELLKACQKTVIIVLHDIALAKLYCDDVMILDKGDLVYHDAVAKIMKPHLLEPIFGVHFVEQALGDKSLLHYY